MRRATFALLVLGLLARPVLAADVVGQAVVDGKVVDLLSDGSWVFHEAMEKPMAADHGDEHAAEDHYENDAKDGDDNGDGDSDSDHAMTDEGDDHAAHAEDGHDDHAKVDDHELEDHAEDEKAPVMADNGTDGMSDNAMDTVLCEDVATGIAFCGQSVWEAVATQGSAADAAFRHADGVFSQIIVEEVGRADGLDLEAIRETVLATAANAMGGTPEDVALLDLAKAEIDGREAASLIYHGEIGGVEVVFANTVLLMDQKTLQAVTIAPEASLSDGHRAAHAGFLADLRVIE